MQVRASAMVPGSGFLLHQQREERARRDPPEEQQVQLHRRRQAAEDARRSRGCAAMRSFGRGPRLLDSAGIHVAGAGRRRVQAARGALRHRVLGHPHQDVLDEAADERRVVADSADAEPARRGRALEVGDVGQRVEMIGLAQALLPHVDQPDALEAASQRVDPAQADSHRRVLADVGVDEQLSARLQHPVRFPQHRRAAPRERGARGRRATTPC